VISFVSKELLPDIVGIRSTYAAYEKERKKKEEWDEQKRGEKKLKESIEKYKKQTSSSVIRRISDEITQIDKNMLTKMEEIVNGEMNAFLPIVGIKTKVDTCKKTILICHTGKDKDLSDLIYELLLFNGVPPNDILYTSCNDEISRIPEDMAVYDYLREFFVKSYSTKAIYVIYVTSSDMAKSWGAVTEVGAGWVTKIDHKVFNIPGCEGYKPAKPLDTDRGWQTSIRTEDGLSMNTIECDRFASKIEHICTELGYDKKRTREKNINKIKEYIVISR